MNLKKNFEFDVHGIVEELKKHRRGMVQTRDQYLYIYEWIIENIQQ
jgi:protein tyrosine phosphatase